MAHRLWLKIKANYCKQRTVVCFFFKSFTSFKSLVGIVLDVLKSLQINYNVDRFNIYYFILGKKKHQLLYIYY